MGLVIIIIWISKMGLEKNKQKEPMGFENGLKKGGHAKWDCARGLECN